MKPTTINATALRIKTRDLMERVKFRGERFIVETFGRPMAVIISPEDFSIVKDILAGAGRTDGNNRPFHVTPRAPTVRRTKARAKRSH